MLHNKLKEMEHGAPCNHIFCPYKHPQPLEKVKRTKHFFTESNHVTYQSKVNGA